MMLIYLIGGHGSGKSTAVKSLMSRGRGVWRTIEAPNRKFPVGYDNGEVFVVGHYEKVNGGSDTVRPLSRLVLALRLPYAELEIVVAEGVGQAGFVRELIRMHRDSFELKIIQLNTDLETCVRSVAERGHKLSRDGVERSWRRSQNAGLELRDAGVSVYETSRRGAVNKLRELTGC